MTHLMTCTCLYNNTAEGASSIHIADARCPEHGGKRMTKPDLEAFAREVLNTFWADRMFPDEPDGGTLQDIAEKHGVLLPHAVAERCGEHCACAEYADFPTTCYRMNPELESADGAEGATMTNEQLAELRDPEHRQAGWWKHIKGTEPVRFGDWEGHSTKSCGFVDVPFERVAFTGPDWHASDDACFRDWRPVLLAAGCEIAERPTGREGLPYVVVFYRQCQASNARTYRAAILAAVAWLAEHKPELLREAIAQVEEGK